ncbi:hypothetical protein Peur_014546 [Populus x canadensis]
MILRGLGFIDPDYMIRSFVTEKTDVFSFGVDEDVYPTIWGNGGEAIDWQQLETFAELALRCTDDSGEDRMMEVAAQKLKLIERSITAP